MFGFAAAKLHEFETGKIGRRQLVEALVLALGWTKAASAEEAQTKTGITIAGVNHISYTCPNAQQAADWYSKMFNIDQVNATQDEVRLPFGKKGEQPYNVKAEDIPLTFISCRTATRQQGESNSQPGRKPRGVVNHVAFTIADFDLARVQAELKSFGIEEFRGASANAIHIKDLFGYDVELSGLGNSASTDGA